MSNNSGSRSCCFQLTLVRHGETEYNDKGIIQGHSDIPLSPVGEQQAELVARRLALERFQLAFSSDLSRARKTADTIASKLRHPVKIVSDPQLRERRLGYAEGRSIAELVAAAKKAGLSLLDYTPPGGESHHQLTTRAKLFFNKLLRECLKHASTAQDHTSGELLSKYRSKQDGVPAPSLHVLLVTHGGWIRNLLEYLKKDCPNVLLPGNALSISPNTGVTSLLVTCRGPGPNIGGPKAAASSSSMAHHEINTVVTDHQVHCTSVTSICVHDGSHL